MAAHFVVSPHASRDALGPQDSAQQLCFLTAHPADGPVPATCKGQRPAPARPSQVGQAAGVTVRNHICLIPARRSKPISDPPLKGSSGSLSRSSQRRPPAPRPFISSE